MLSQEFEYKRAASTAEAARLKRELPGGVYLGGGTDVVPLMQYGLLRPRALIAVSELEELRQIRREGAALAIGGAVTLHRLQRHCERQPHLRGLAMAAKAVASPQIRRMGTVAGNLLQERRCFYFNQTAQWREGIQSCYKTGGDICHQAPASPVCRALYYSDLAPMIIALGGTLRLSGDEATSADAVCGEPEAIGDKLVEAILLPDIDEVRYTAFAKTAVRGAIDFALANAALVLRSDNRIRLVMGAMNPRPVPLEETASLLEQTLREGGPFPGGVYEAARREARKLARPIREAGVTGAAKLDATGAVLQVIRELDLGRCPNPQTF